MPPPFLQVTEIHALPTALPTDKKTAPFTNYVVEASEKPIFSGNFSSMVKVTDKLNHGDQVLAMRDYYPTSTVKPDSEYLKVLRFIGK